jgi:hypothetical protein
MDFVATIPTHIGRNKEYRDTMAHGIDFQEKK